MCSDPNHQNVIYVSSDDEYGGDKDFDDLGDENDSQDGKSSYFQAPPEVDAFNARCKRSCGQCHISCILLSDQSPKSNHTAPRHPFVRNHRAVAGVVAAHIEVTAVVGLKRVAGKYPAVRMESLEAANKSIQASMGLRLGGTIEVAGVLA